MPVFQHQEDDGNLNIFASGDLVVIACEYGHYWVIEAKQHSSETVKPALEEALPTAEAEALINVI